MHTQSIVCARVKGQCLEYLVYITLRSRRTNLDGPLDWLVPPTLLVFFYPPTFFLKLSWEVVELITHHKSQKEEIWNIIMPTESSEKPTIVLPIKDSKIRFQNDNCLADLFLVDFQSGPLNPMVWPRFLKPHCWIN